MDNPFGLGAHESSYDSRTWRHDTTTAAPLTTGGVKYDPADIDNQHIVGICTAISLTQNANKATGKKYSPDFQYLLQKKFFDFNWWEGSSIFNALKAATKYGLLPIELFTYVTEADRNLSYPDYVEKLQAISESEVQRLIGLCEKPMTGYASVPADAQSMAKAISDSKSGILCRYSVGEEWWTPSWQPQDIDPLRPPQQVVSGHAIGQSYFDFTLNQKFELPNTWGTQWNDNGKAHTIFPQYHATEAWIPYYGTPPQPLPPSFIFTVDMKYGQRSEDVKQLQKRLAVSGTGYYGDLTAQAVLKFQVEHNLALSWYERYILRGKLCGAKTRQALNSLS